MRQSEAIIDCLLLQIENNNLINNRFARGNNKLLQSKNYNKVPGNLSF